MGSSSTSEDPSDYTPSACVSEAGTSPSSSSPSLPLQTSTDVDLSEVEMMKERFAKLLLGEDMSGGGKGVCTALAVSNAITNLSASVFGQLWRLEPLKVQKKEFWKREMEWLLSICDSIVELVPSLQEFPLPGGGGSGGGGKFEVMAPRLRSDLRVNLPALRKLDAMLVTLLDGFHDTEFWYVDRGLLFGEEGNRGGDGYPPAKPPVRQEDKWWLPCPRVPPNGLSEEARRRLEQCRDYANQILKAALVINSEVLADMAVPQVYYETLPQSGKSCLGDFIYQYITTDRFSSEFLLDCLDLSSEHQTLEIVNCVEAACQVWRKKAGRDRSTYKKVKKPSWSGKVKDLITDDSHKSQFLAQRAELLLQSLKLRYPGLPQTVLDMNKIQFNKDVGQSILESYSRVIESLAFNIIARVDDLIYVDDATKKCAASDASALFNPGVGSLPIIKRISPCPSSNQSTPFSSPFTTPRLCFSTNLCSAQSSLSKRSSGGQNLEDSVEKAISADVEAVNLETGNLSLAKDSVATLE